MRNMKFFKSSLAATLSLAMTLTSFAGAAPVALAAEDDAAAAPKAFLTLDFNNGYDDIAAFDADYEVVKNGAEPKLVKENYDGEDIQVLELQPSTGEDVYTMDYYNRDQVYAGKTENSTIKMKNPFATLGADYYKEYEETDIPGDGSLKQEVYDTRYQPVWTKGAVMNYWIKVPTAEAQDAKGRTVGINSSIFTWDLVDYQFQADDYAKYLVRHKFDVDVAKQDPSIEVNESGVPEDSDFWFAYAKDEDGQVKMFEGDDGTVAPVLDAKSSDEAKNKFGRYFAANPNYVQGYIGNDESDYTLIFNESIASYNTLPEITDQVDAAGETVINFGTSKVRVAKTHGAMQIDSDSSFLWNNDSEFGVNLNPNLIASHGTRGDVQNGDRMFMNSWKGNTGDDEAPDNAPKLADSPYSLPGEWHMVTVTLQNDWVEFYLDGETVDVRSNYATRGGTGLGGGRTFKRLNKGTGMRYGYGSEKGMIDASYGNYVCRLMLDWLTNPETTFAIGGVTGIEGGVNRNSVTHPALQSDADAALFNMSTKTDTVKIAKVEFFADMMTEDQIADLYAAGMHPTAAEKGDVNGKNGITADDALATLQIVVKLITPTDEQTAAADVDGKNGVTADDALMILQKVVKLIKEFPA